MWITILISWINGFCSILMPVSFYSMALSSQHDIRVGLCLINWVQITNGILQTFCKLHRAVNSGAGSILPYQNSSFSLFNRLKIPFFIISRVSWPYHIIRSWHFSTDTHIHIQLYQRALKLSWLKIYISTTEYVICTILQNLTANWAA
jgi:hypothetical protein